MVFMSLFFLAFLIPLFILPSQGHPSDGYETWLSALRRDAQKQGVRQTTLDAVLNHLILLPEVLKKQKKQPEKLRSLGQYLAQIASSQRISTAREKMKLHQTLLQRISQRYGVQPRFIVALWGVESNFGQNSGSNPIIPALATLAYGGKRADYFRRELLVALRILDEGHVPLEQMKGSWAGAMGQCQFMPWNFLHRAVDFDGDGRRDIWNSTDDVLASIAHFLSRLGWRDDLTWGREVVLPASFSQQAPHPSGTQKNLQECQQLGVRRMDGQNLPRRSVRTTLIRPSRSGGRAFLVYANYHALLKWNKSNLFALAIGHIADQIDD